MLKKLSLKKVWIVWFFSSLVFSVSIIGMYEEVFLSDVHWISLITLSGIVGFVFFWGQLKLLVKGEDKKKFKYFIFTIITFIVLFLILYNYHHLLVALGLRQPFDLSQYQQ